MTGPPRDRWLIAKTDRRYPYPCFCRSDRRSCGTRYCPCWGRTDPPSPRCCERGGDDAQEARAPAQSDVERRTAPPGWDRIAEPVQTNSGRFEQGSDTGDRVHDTRPGRRTHS